MGILGVGMGWCENPATQCRNDSSRLEMLALLDSVAPLLEWLLPIGKRVDEEVDGGN
jgi:hypothetical protein